MRRVILVSVATATAVSVLFFMVFHSDGQWEKQLLEQAQPASSDGFARESVSKLKLDIEQLRDQIARVNDILINTPGTKDQSAAGDQVARIQALEAAVEGILHDGQGARRKPGRSSSSRILATGRQSGEIQELERIALAEQEFESDTGLQLGDFDDSVEEAIYQVDGIELKGMDCRNSICKVSYRSREPTSADLEGVDPEWELMEQLLARSNGKRVDIRHTTDVLGNKTMYIQLK